VRNFSWPSHPKAAIPKVKGFSDLVLLDIPEGDVIRDQKHRVERIQSRDPDRSEVPEQKFPAIVSGHEEMVMNMAFFS
jgi:hypothetical protein